ncbi:TIGR03915 family putative DNA repair protein [Anaeromicropila herbilytica]|uniref:DNA metabolism protein n=1 Tax=Anaeromicropila herbilytica TaxID=2785025 RepID=A0A7R7EME8_9FIRM|nr:TIGR03915 family putative DNA repair protein [Anaeromicropila herbilytica]BCN31439.1 DNA metabolism protein [Anaeromicropila herbilytica]
MTIYLCEDSIDGIFTAIYDAWASKKGHANVRIELQQENTYELFHEYIAVVTDTDKALKVAKTINDRLGNEVYQELTKAALSCGEDKADAIYRVLILGFSLKKGNKVLDCLSNESVFKVFEYSRKANNEAHHLLGFIRFVELDNGVLFAKINPKNNIITILSAHFHIRMPLENWMIYDENRKLAIVYKKETVPVLVSGEEIDSERIERVSDNEKEFQQLWNSFFESICIKERVNLKLQMNNLPKRFWSNMTEMKDKI